MNTTTATAINFNNVAYTEASLSELSGPALVELYNEVLGTFRNGESVQNVRRFADKTTAIARTWKILQRYAEANQEAEADEQAEAKKVETVNETTTTTTTAVAASKAAKSTAEKKARAPRGTNLVVPGHAPIPCREGSKQAMLLDMLSRPNGATMTELIEALSGGNKPWTEATVRSGFGWDMKLKGYGVRSAFDADGTERFHIVVPEGHAIPAHKPLKSASKADARQTRLIA
jgi:hypothetical protein